MVDDGHTTGLHPQVENPILTALARVVSVWFPLPDAHHSPGVSHPHSFNYDTLSPCYYLCVCFDLPETLYSPGVPQATATERKAVYMAPMWAAPDAKR
jgi:hypothetical protein